MNPAEAFIALIHGCDVVHGGARLCKHANLSVMLASENVGVGTLCITCLHDQACMH